MIDKLKLNITSKEELFVSYSIMQDLLPVGTNRPGESLSPIGVTIHDTDDVGATAQNEVDYFHGGDRDASAHFFVDDVNIIQIIPEDEVAWHAGYTANHKFLSIELCDFDDENKFQETWDRGVWLTAQLCQKYGWTPDTAVVSHKWCSDTYQETDHQDPIPYFSDHGKTFDDFINDVKSSLTTIVKIEVNGKVLDGILINGVTYAPVRSFGEALGLTVVWDQATGKVTVGGVAVQVQLIDGCSYAPVRTLAEALGHQVTWDQNTQTVIIE